MKAKKKPAPLGVKGKVVAIVGRAASILGSGAGPEIDGADVVIRCNCLLPLPAELAGDIGTRTDLVYTCASCEAIRENAKAHGVRAVKSRWKWRKRLSKESRLGLERYRPTTGLVAIRHALEEGARELRIFGIDFYASGYAKPQPCLHSADTEALPWRHDPEEDVRLLSRMWARDNRIVPDDALRARLAKPKRRKRKGSKAA